MRANGVSVDICLQRQGGWRGLVSVCLHDFMTGSEFLIDQKQTMVVGFGSDVNKLLK